MSDQKTWKCGLGYPFLSIRTFLFCAQLSNCFGNQLRSHPSGKTCSVYGGLINFQEAQKYNHLLGEQGVYLLAGMEGERHWEHNCDLLDSCSSLPVGSTLPLGRHQGWDAACLRLSRLILDSWGKPDGL